MLNPTLRINRRGLLSVGMLSSAFSMASLLRAESQASEDADRSGILVFLGGGPAHQDTFDLKPEAPADYRGQFRPIATKAPGVRICEHLPQLAQRADQFAVIRGLTHNLAAHGLGARYLMTGNRPTPVIRHPSYGSVASKELSGEPDLPRFVSIDRAFEGPGYLGREHGPLATGEKPRYGQPFRVRGVSLGDGVSIEKFRRRRALLDRVDTQFRGHEDLDESVRGLDRFSRQAFDIISSPRTRDAFDLKREKEKEVDRFGRHEFGQCLLLTSRLVEAGVRFVTVQLDGWDTHEDNFNTLGRELLPRLDQSLSALFDRLGQSGRLETTSVLVTGEFGRTPKINKRAGRDHWARASCALMAGGDISGGVVAGATDARAEGPQEKGFTPDDLAATFFKNLGIDPRTEYQTDIGRPITLVRDGAPIAELIGD